MSIIFPGRFTAKFDESFAVFIIGMRVNHLLQSSKWIPVAKAMPPMIAELKEFPEMGLLHLEQMIYWRGVATIQYWRSFDHLHAYAHMREGNHLPAWAEFNRKVGGNGAVGIRHESFLVERGNYECVYVNMPRFGFGATDHVPVSGRLESARQRIGKAE